MSVTLSYTIDLTIDDAKNYTRSANTAFSVRFFTWILKGIEKRMVRNFTRLNVEFEGLLNKLSESVELGITEDDYKQFRTMVNLLTMVNEKYREIDYMESNTLQEVMNNTLTLAYEIEAELKMASHAVTSPDDQEKKLFKAMSKNSGYAISKKLSHQF